MPDRLWGKVLDFTQATAKRNRGGGLRTGGDTRACVSGMRCQQSSSGALLCNLYRLASLGNAAWIVSRPGSEARQMFPRAGQRGVAAWKQSALSAADGGPRRAADSGRLRWERRGSRPATGCREVAAAPMNRVRPLKWREE